MDKSERYEAVSAILLMTVFCVVWYFTYVKPNDDRRGAVVQCMKETDNYTFEGWQACSKSVDQF